MGDFNNISFRQAEKEVLFSMNSDCSYQVRDTAAMINQEALSNVRRHFVNIFSSLFLSTHLWTVNKGDGREVEMHNTTSGSEGHVCVPGLSPSLACKGQSKAKKIRCRCSANIFPVLGNLDPLKFKHPTFGISKPRTAVRQERKQQEEQLAVH
uniref:Uncharacterized protein n=1 Tax=Steinernema glaseri TaxID=37863 RepID=A0A1I8AJ58_9BILA